MFEISFSDLNSLDIDRVFDALTKFGDIYFKNKHVYLFAGDTKKNTINRSLSKLVGSGNFMVKDILPSEYDSYDASLSDWMKYKSYNFEMSKILAEKEEEFKKYNEMMMKIKEEYDKKQESGGGDIVETSGLKE